MSASRFFLKNTRKSLSEKSDSNTLSSTDIAADISAFCTKMGIEEDFGKWDMDELRGLSLDAAVLIISDKTKAARLVSKVRGLVRQADPNAGATPRTNTTTPRNTAAAASVASPSIPARPAAPSKTSSHFLTGLHHPHPVHGSHLPNLGPTARVPAFAEASANDQDQTDDGATLVGDLRHLAAMRNDGVLSEQEFQQFKALVLQSPRSSSQVMAQVSASTASKAASGRNGSLTKSAQNSSVGSIAKPAETKPAELTKSTSNMSSKGKPAKPAAAPIPIMTPAPPVVEEIFVPKPRPSRPKKTTVSTETAKVSTLSVVVFGASGDLAKKKTFPALFHLFAQGFVAETTVFYGYARTSLSDENFREKLRSYVEKEARQRNSVDKVDAFLNQCVYKYGEYDQPAGFEALTQAMAASEHSRGGTVGRLFYLALPPTVFPTVATQVKAHCMLDTTNGGFNRVVVEKPFGRDLASSEKLASHLGGLFTEDEIYRIDHYLGKELVQNLLTLRFTNLAFESTWNRQYVSSVAITFKEPFGTEGRGGYFDESGIIRDILQNHLLQVLAIVAMEPPNDLSPEEIRDEKTRVLEATRPIKLTDVVIGQYIADSKGNLGYKDDPTVPKDSITPTFASVVLHIDNDRWRGVPFFLKAGKALNDRKAEIRIQYKPPKESLVAAVPNELVMRLQPSEAIYFKINTKTPGLSNEPRISELNLSYADRFQDVTIPDAYERLILDVINGDHQHFVRRDELVAAWKIFTPILHRLERAKVVPTQYVFGGRGPTQSDDMMERYGFIRTDGYTWNA
eukprot:c8980_g1_i1.p1 GENE.c8980_g1_i1~~c8980_g1_i1.p1  ORF type:complete len:795 (+),score=199.14 c8980_g1_i1:160-2544(+)